MQRGSSRKQNRRISAMTKKATAAMTALVMMVVPMTAFAGDFEDFYDYQAENGKYVYYFENGIPNNFSNSLASSSDLAVVTNIISIPLTLSTLSYSISGNINCSFIPKA